MNMVVPASVLLREATLAKSIHAPTPPSGISRVTEGLLEASHVRSTDAVLIGLKEAWAKSWARCVAADAVEEDNDEAEEERMAAHDECIELRERILERPAQTLDAILFRVRVASDMIKASEPGHSPAAALTDVIDRSFPGCDAEAIGFHVFRDLVEMLDAQAKLAA